MLAKRKIRKSRNIHNFDESGIRIGYPQGEIIVVSINYKEKHTQSPKNQQSLSIMKSISADEREPSSPTIIISKKKKTNYG